MAVRAPLYYANNSLQEMSSTQITNYVRWAAYQYGQSPSVTLDVVPNGDGDDKFEMENTYYKAGAASLSNSSFAANPADIELATVSFKTISETVTSVSPPTFTDPPQDLAFPVYLDADNNIRAMSEEDFIDTFIKPALESLNNTSSDPLLSPGGYFIFPNSTGISNATIVSNDPVFTDTVASDDFLTGNLPEDVDQQQDSTSWYLWQINNDQYSGTGSDGQTITDPYLDAWPMVYNETEGSLNQIVKATLNSYLQLYMGNAASETVGSRTRYYIYDDQDPNFDANKRRGFGMVDKVRTNSFLLRQQQIGDNYYSQEVPDGTITTNKTYYLQLVLE